MAFAAFGRQNERKDSNSNHQFPSSFTRTTSLISSSATTTTGRNLRSVATGSGGASTSAKIINCAPPAPGPGKSTAVTTANFQVNGKSRATATSTMASAGQIGFSSFGGGNSNSHKMNNIGSGPTPSAMSATAAANKLKKPRKLWTLQDRSAISVNLLKANLAEDGCDEAQLDMAKKLLNEVQATQGSLQESDTSRKAVYWLIKSSEQGNEEATKLLEECLKSGRGISCQNISDVRTCIQTARNEKLTFRAARILHAKLSNGEEFITTTQLRARLQSRKDRLSPTRVNPPSPYAMTDDTDDSSSDNGTESGRSNYHSPGLSPSLNSTFVVDPEDTTHFNIPNNQNGFGDAGPGPGVGPSTPLLAEQKYLQSPSDKLVGAKMTLDDLIKTASAHNAGQIPFIPIDPEDIVPPNRTWDLCSFFSAFFIQFTLHLYLTEIITFASCFLLGSIYVLLWSSYNLRLWRKREHNFQAWTDSFKSVLKEGSWTELKSENRLKSNWLTSYLMGSVISLIIFALLPEDYNLAKGTFGAVMVLSISHSTFNKKVDVGFLYIFLLVVPLIKAWAQHFYPQISVQNLLLDRFTEYLTPTPGFLQDFLPEYITTNVFLSTLQGIAILTLILGREVGFSEFLILLWFQMTAHCWLGMSYEELFICILLLLTFEPLYLLVTSDKKLFLAAAGLILLCTAVISVISYGVFCMPVVGVTRAHCSSMSGSGSAPGHTQALSWEEYNVNCHEHAWKIKSQSVAQTQIHCSLKYDTDTTRVQWTGIVSLVKVNQIEDKVAKGGVRGAIFEVLVNIVDNSGEESDPKKNGDGDGVSWTWLRFNGDKSSNSNQDFPQSSSILVWLSTTNLGEIEKLKATKYVLSLRTGDRIEFNGFLIKNLGGLQPEVGNVDSVKCVSCAVADYGEIIFQKPSPRFGFKMLDEFYGNLELIFRKMREYFPAYWIN